MLNDEENLLFTLNNSLEMKLFQKPSNDSVNTQDIDASRSLEKLERKPLIIRAKQKNFSNLSNTSFLSTFVNVQKAANRMKKNLFTTV